MCDGSWEINPCKWSSLLASLLKNISCIANGLSLSLMSALHDRQDFTAIYSVDSLSFEKGRISLDGAFFYFIFSRDLNLYGLELCPPRKPWLFIKHRKAETINNFCCSTLLSCYARRRLEIKRPANGELILNFAFWSRTPHQKICYAGILLPHDIDDGTTIKNGNLGHQTSFSVFRAW